MGDQSDGSYRATRPQEPISDATNALAHRLRIAVATGWDGERCDVAATEFVSELTRRGWSPPRPTAAPTWRGLRNPEVTERGVAAARAALAAAKTTTEATP